MLLLGLFAFWQTRRKTQFFALLVLSIITLFFGVNVIFLFVKRLRYVIILSIPFALYCGFTLSYFYRWKISRLLSIVFVGVWIVVGHQFTYTDDYNRQMSKDRPVQYPEYNHLAPLLREHTEKRELLIIVHYRFSAIQQSKQELRGIHQYYMDDLKLKESNFPLYPQWSDSGIDATPLDYAMGLIPQYDMFWFSYHHTRITEDISEFQNRVAESFTICKTYDYGERSTLVQYVSSETLVELCIQ
jgi:hypothetical protein